MMLIRAFILCMTKHWKQKDKSGKRYVWHPINVMLNVKGYNEKITALLHDIIEDTELTIDNLKAMKFNPEIIEAVNIITKKSGQEYWNILNIWNQLKIMK
ncbi:MAG: GTP pyrophosphokinase [Leptotrichiaceae bacterium]|nr:GTP pyrophosphokinase [Leptotrichiaceae bacterium]